MDNNFRSATPGFLQIVGKTIFSSVVLLELLMISFIGPALTSGAISSERERQTIDLLRVSLLSAPALALGKLGSSVIFLLLLIFTAIPVQSLAFFLGGVGFAEMVISTLMLVVTAVFFCTLGLFFSSFAKRTLIATVSSYGSILLSFIAFLVFLFMMGVFSSSLISPPSSPNSALYKDVFTVILWLSFSTNPFFAAGMSEAILINDQSVFFTTSGLFFGSTSFPILSPWIIYVTFYSFMALVLTLASMYFVSRPDK
jgi:ABC-type transport system involved in multi-copper enzyme maturation permease subunit